MIRHRELLNNGWTFAFGQQAGAETDPTDPGWFDVGLPHSFDLPDFREQRFYTGYGCYRRRVEVREEWIGSWIALEFLGVFQVADVFVNGVQVGRHEGGYTPFVVDVTSAVRAGANEVFVRVDNLWNPELAPRAGDYGFAGGIYRDVSLLVAPTVRLDWYGIGVTTPEVDAEAAAVTATVDVVNDTDTEVAVSMEGVVRFRGEEVLLLTGDGPTIPSGAMRTAQLSGVLRRPRLWHPDHPDLYRLEVSVSIGGAATDRDSADFGVRWFGFTPHDGFFLNGERLDLHGANVHQNHGGWGDAVTRAGMRRDIAMIKDLGMNIIRGSHYPHHPFFTAECDRQGLLYWSELHFWGIGGENVDGYWFASAYPVHEEHEAAFEESLRRALREMVRTQRNHPSIVTWSIGNEAFFSDDHVIEKAKALTVELVELAHELDPSRPAAVGGAQRKGFDTLGDVAGYNGDGAALFPDPGIPNIVSEYHGAGGLGAGDFEVHWDYGVEEDLRWRSGKILWCAFHYKTVADGAGLGGIVNYFRVPRRPYYWYREKLRSIPRPEFPESGTAVSIAVHADEATIPTDGTGDTKLTATLHDSAGRHVDDKREITFTVVEGAGLFPSGRSITLSPDDDSVIDGTAAIEFRSYEPGTNRIVVGGDGLAPAEVTIVATGDPVEGGRPRRLMTPAPYVTEPPRAAGETSLAAYRPVATSSAAPGCEGSHVTSAGSGSAWRPGTQRPGEWIMADLEFPYDVGRIDVVFAEKPTDPWVLETTIDSRTFHRIPVGDAEAGALSISAEFEPRKVSAVRIRFPERPASVAEIRVY